MKTLVLKRFKPLDNDFSTPYNVFEQFFGRIY